MSLAMSSTTRHQHVLIALLLFLSVQLEAQFTLFNGGETTLFDTAPTACLNALNTTVNCVQRVQLLSYDLSYLNFASSDLTALCTSSCATSLRSLQTSVGAACGTYSVAFNGANMSVPQVLDYYNFKYNLTCLQDTTTGQFCELEQQAWNISQLNSSGQATWPTYINKTYPNWYYNDDGSPLVDVDGSYIDAFVTLPPFTQALNGTTDLNVKDFYVNASAYAGNYGLDPTDAQYEADELPLQYQCSNCAVNRWIMAYQSTWGFIFDEVAVQVWSNMQQNCNLTHSLIPAYNMSAGGLQTTLGPLQYVTTTCPNSINATGIAMTCAALALEYQVESASVANLNSGLCNALQPGTYCSAQSCSIARVPGPMSMRQFLQAGNYTNITLTQLSNWNPYSPVSNLQTGDIVCVGPPGGAYIPPTSTVQQAYPTIYTTTAKPATSTPSGTVANCGKYYQVQSGDYCNLVALNNSITSQTLLNLNPSINCNCTNLLLGYDYCVAPVNGTNVANVTCTAGTTATSTSTTATSTSSSCTAYVAAPTQTVAGTTTHCCVWYTVVSGDSCYTIDTKYGISLNQFRSWNTYIDAACDNLWVGYAYCVGSSDPLIASIVSTAPSTGSVTQAASSNTVISTKASIVTSLKASSSTTATTTTVSKASTTTKSSTTTKAASSTTIS